jgi:hypothetical protein
VNASVDAGDYDSAVHALDWNPLEGETPDDGEHKHYAKGVGLVVDASIELIEFTPGG